MVSKPLIPSNENDITADWLARALADGGASDVPEIHNAIVEEIGSGVGLVGKILRCHLTYGAAGGPETVIVKLPSAHPETFRMAMGLGLYRREYAFYRQIAPHIPLRSPALWYGDFDDASHRFVLVLEDLRDMAAADQLDGASAEQAKTAIRAIARLHGFYWNKVDQPSVAGFQTASDRERRQMTQAAYQANLGPALERFGELFPHHTRQLAEDYATRLADHLEAVSAGPQTFTHGDFRLDNLFFAGDGGKSEDFAAVDWQVCGIASGLQDVAYFLSSSVATEVRRQIEREALAEYHDVILSMGAEEFTFTECWRSYRQNMLGCLRTPIIAGGQLDFSSDRSRQLAEVFLQRTLTAIDDLDAHEFLPGR